MIDYKESWRRANTWLSSTPAKADPAKAEKVRQSLADAESKWEQPGQAAPLVEEACRLAGLELATIPPAQPAPTTTPTQPAQPAPTTTPTQPAQPAPTQPAPVVAAQSSEPSIWQRLGRSAAIATATGVAAGVGALVGVGLVGLGAIGVSVGLGVVGAVVAIKRGGLGAVIAAVGLVVATGVGVAVVVGGHVHATAAGVGALLAGAGIAALLAGGDELVAAMRMAADKGGSQRPQR